MWDVVTMFNNHAMMEGTMNFPSVKTQVKLMSVTNLMTGHVLLEEVENHLMIKLLWRVYKYHHHHSRIRGTIEPRNKFRFQA